MRRNRRQRGEGQLGCVIGLLFLLIAIFIAYKFIPVKVKAADMRQTVVDEAKSGGIHDDALIMKMILAKAEELDLPITKENVEIRRHASQIKVEVQYTVPVKFPGFVYQWKFHHTAENPIF